jgi:hypothetical protein
MLASTYECVTEWILGYSCSSWGMREHFLILWMNAFPEVGIISYYSWIKWNGNLVPALFFLRLGISMPCILYCILHTEERKLGFAVHPLRYAFHLLYYTWRNGILFCSY